MPKPTKKKPTIKIDEKSLEDLAEEPDMRQEEFSEFMPQTSSEMPTPTIKSAPTENKEGDESLEEIGKTAPLTTSTKPAEEIIPKRDYMMVYNQPDYSERTPEETVMKETSERHMAGRTAEQLRHLQPKAIMEDWHEMPDTARTGGGALNEYSVTSDIEVRERTEDTLPFQQSGLKDYRPLKRGRKG